MATTTAYPHLTFDADGTARIGLTRYKVSHLAAEHYHHGWTAEELLRQHPDLKPGEVYSSLTYFYDHFDEFIAAWKEQELSEVTHAQPFSRAELLRRRAKTSVDAG